MKLEIAKLRADGYNVEVIVNHNTDKWDKYIKNYVDWQKALAWVGGVAGMTKHPRDFITTEFKVTKRKTKAITFDKTGDVTAIPASAFAEAAKRDIARGIDTSSCDSSLQQLMRVFTEIKQ